MTTRRSMRVAIWVESLLGYGHAIRAISLAHALRPADCLIVSGSIAGNSFLEAQLGDCRLAALPTLTMESPVGALAPVGGGDVPSVEAARVATAWSAIQRLRPEVFIIEHFPFGRWGFASEIWELIGRMRETFPCARVIASVRDIPQGDERIPEYGTVVRSILEAAFDQVVVHGDRRLTDLEEFHPEVRGLEIPIAYTGYIGPDDAPVYDRNGPVVLDFGGGWESSTIGAQLIDALTAIDPKRRIVIVSGRRGTLERGRKKLGAKSKNVSFVVDRSKRCSRARAASLYITRGGYNAAASVLVGTVPTVIIPHAFSAEQRLRAKLLARVRRVVVLPEESVADAYSALKRCLAEAYERSLTWQPLIPDPAPLRHAILP